MTALSLARQDNADPVPAALAALRAGRPVHLVDDVGVSGAGVAGDGAGDGVLVLAAALADPTWVAWTVRHTSGLLRAARAGARR